MKTFYETPEANIVNFQAMENLAVIEDSAVKPEGDVESKDF